MSSDLPLAERCAVWSPAGKADGARLVLQTGRDPSSQTSNVPMGPRLSIGALIRERASWVSGVHGARDNRRHEIPALGQKLSPSAASASPVPRDQRTLNSCATTGKGGS